LRRFVIFTLRLIQPKINKLPWIMRFESFCSLKRNLQFMPYDVFTETPIFTNHYEAMMKAKEWGVPVTPYIRLCHGLNEVKQFIEEYGN